MFNYRNKEFLIQKEFFIGKLVAINYEFQEKELMEQMFLKIQQEKQIGPHLLMIKYDPTFKKITFECETI